MLHERILVLVKYVTDAIAGPFGALSKFRIDHKSLNFLGRATKDHATLRALAALVASLPATENKAFRQEFNTVSDPAVCLIGPRLTCIFIVRNMKMSS